MLTTVIDVATLVREPFVVVLEVGPCPRLLYEPTKSKTLRGVVLLNPSGEPPAAPVCVISLVTATVVLPLEG